MTLLPIAERELRIASRKSSTFWLRTATSLAGLIIGAACLLLMHLGAFGGPAFGKALFGILTWLSLIAVIAAGLFFTSDSLSQEKREGTLGLLFLTDLRGYDVVTGKLLATSLRGFYALLAIFPVLAMTLIMGGVTGAQFWKGSLALLNALFFSLTTGMAVSALSRDFQKALLGTLLLLLLFSFGGPIADGTAAAIQGRGFRPMFSVSSPGYLLVLAGAWGRSPYWLTLAITQGIAWSFFVVASLAASKTWQERGRTGPGQSRNWAGQLKHGGPRRKAKLRAKLMDRNVVLWLVCRERWQSLGMWVVSLLAVTGFILILIYWPSEAWMVWNYLAAFLLLVIYLAVASQASRFMVEARRSGLTELLLATPLREREIVWGNWRGLTRMFVAPVALILCVNLIGTTLSLQSWGQMANQANAAAAAAAVAQSAKSVTNSSGTVVTTSSSTNTSVSITLSGPVTSSGVPSPLVIALGIFTGGLPALANLIALCWFGMWMGHTSSNGHLAALKTLMFVQVIPWMVIHFVSYIAMVIVMIPMFSGSPLNSGNWLSWWPITSAVLTSVLALAKDIVFTSWAKNKLYGSFREQAVRDLGGVVLGASIPQHLPPAPPQLLPIISRDDSIERQS
jgi:hypothetical protein